MSGCDVGESISYGLGSIGGKAWKFPGIVESPDRVLGEKFMEYVKEAKPLKEMDTNFMLKVPGLYQGV